MESHGTAAAAVLPHHHFCYFKPAIPKDRAEDIKVVRGLVELHCNRTLKPVTVFNINSRELALLLAVEANQKIRDKILAKLIKLQQWIVLKQALRFLTVAERRHLFGIIWKQVNSPDPAIVAGVFDPNAYPLMCDAFQLLAEFLRQEKQAAERVYHFHRIILLYDHKPLRRIFILRYLLINLLDTLDQDELNLFISMLKKAKSALDNNVYEAFLDIMRLIQERKLLPIEILEKEQIRISIVATVPDEKSQQFSLKTVEGLLAKLNLHSSVYIPALADLELAIRHGDYLDLILSKLLLQLQKESNVRNERLNHKIYHLFLQIFQYVNRGAQNKIEQAFIDALDAWPQHGNIPVSLQMILSMIPKVDGNVDFFQQVLRKYQVPLLKWGIPDLCIVELNYLLKRDEDLREQYHFRYNLLNDVPLYGSVKDLVTAYRFKI